MRTATSLTAAIEEAFSAEPADEWLRRLEAVGVPAGKVRDFQQVYEWEQTRSQGLLIDVDHPTLGRIQLPGPPLRFDDHPYAGARETNLPHPAWANTTRPSAPGSTSSELFTGSAHRAW